MILTKCNGQELNNGLFQSHGEQWKRLRCGSCAIFTSFFSDFEQLVLII